MGNAGDTSEGLGPSRGNSSWTTALAVVVGLLFRSFSHATDPKRRWYVALLGWWLPQPRSGRDATGRLHIAYASGQSAISAAADCT
jgi:hypothetical protein